MSHELISILVLAAVFFIATVLPIHMGALALVAAYALGTLVLGEDVDTILGGFPADLFMILVGITYLFALASDNGTVDCIVARAVKSVGGRVALIPWVMFGVTGVLTAVGAVVPASVAIIAPIAMGFAKRYEIRPLLMGLMVINGASAGGFSPLSIFGSIVNGVVERNNLPSNPGMLFLCTALFNILLSVFVYVMFGGRELIGKIDTGDGLIVHKGRNRRGEGEASSGSTRPQPGGTGAAGVAEGPSGGRLARASTTAVQTTPVLGGATTATDTALDRARVITLVGIAALATSVLFFGMDVGFTALLVAVVVSLFSPNINKGAIGKIAWPTVLLICGIVTYVSMMERIGTIDWLGGGVAGIGVPLLSAIVICLIGAVVSAFASTTGILGALIPLAVPFLLSGQIGAVAMIIALCISSSTVDSSPFSTSGALVVANSPEEQRDKVFRQLTIWGFSMVAIAPILTFLIFILPGWG
ncbi:SLC13 family permease [Mycobacterium sp. 236(2023)]|uniref:SLC13 family permease n=1 Tax=Mycobacterium sp. 236(2023) TaxID=3038163 RepID=UPI0024150304|nr:SLC13 family permease [Mycobacterium sp. 236(2023)]MDG4669379.1 SLC13 family permease [Mycobacterium sp. 236(2023)]